MSAFLLNYLVNCAAYQSENMKIMEPEATSYKQLPHEKILSRHLN